VFDDSTSQFTQTASPLGVVVKNIFVGNLDYSTTSEDLMSVFATHGAVERVNVIKDKETGQSRGFAFVEMTNDAEADNAINALNGAPLGTRRLRVNEARPQESGSGPRGPRREGGFRGPGGGGGGYRDSRGGGYRQREAAPSTPSNSSGQPQWYDE
jgi:cold-inducible RNA-binding protein